MINSPIEPYKLSSWAKSRGYNKCFLYLGPSMTPTFQSGDFLYLRPAPWKLAIGDVIVFSDIKNGFIVHRIIEISDDTLVTRGDHNRLVDSPLTLDQVVGKVELVENKAGRKHVINGTRGLWKARMRYSVSKLGFFFRQMFRTPYQLLRKSGFMSAIWQPSIIKIHLQSEDATLVKYIHNNRTVAIWNATIQKFDCLKPYDLVIVCPEGSKENVLMV